MTSLTKRAIYKILTLENGIEINLSALNYLMTKLSDEKSVNIFVDSCKRKLVEKSIGISQIDMILSEDEITLDNFYTVSDIKYSKISLYKRLKYLKSYISTVTCTVEEKDAFLIKIMRGETVENAVLEGFNFYVGIYYANKMGLHVFETERKLFYLKFDFYTEDAVFFDNMVLGLVGVCVGDTFYVYKKSLPLIPLPTNVNRNLSFSTENKVLIFNGINGMTKKIESVIERHNPRLILYTSSNECFIKKPGLQSICCSENSKTGFLPYKNSKLAHKKEYASNPFEINFYNKKIALISMDVYQYKEKCLFLNSNSFDSFYEAYGSQGVIDPFGLSYLRLENTIPNILIIAQDTTSFVKRLENGMIIMGVSSFNKDKTIGILNTNTDEYEIEFIQ